jgi:hypothetical protein
VSRHDRPKFANVAWMYEYDAASPAGLAAI